MKQDVLSEIVRSLEPFRRESRPITAETEIAADLDLDSLAVMDLLLDVEDKFDITIPLNLIPEVRTVGDLVKVVERLKEEA